MTKPDIIKDSRLAGVLTLILLYMPWVVVVTVNSQTTTPFLTQHARLPSLVTCTRPPRRGSFVLYQPTPAIVKDGRLASALAMSAVISAGHPVTRSRTFLKWAVRPAAVVMGATAAGGTRTRGRARGRAPRRGLTRARARTATAGTTSSR